MAKNVATSNDRFNMLWPTEGNVFSQAKKILSKQDEKEIAKKFIQNKEKLKNSDFLA